MVVELVPSGQARCPDDRAESLVGILPESRRDTHPLMQESCDRPRNGHFFKNEYPRRGTQTLKIERFSEAGGSKSLLLEIIGIRG